MTAWWTGVKNNSFEDYIISMVFAMPLRSQRGRDHEIHNFVPLDPEMLHVDTKIDWNWFICSREEVENVLKFMPYTQWKTNEDHKHRQ